jgi:hypothetical protein
MKQKAPDDPFNEQETVRSREAALKRMLSTPHQPHQPIGKKKVESQEGQVKKRPLVCLVGLCWIYAPPHAD